jgi:hypothetical protein
VVRVERSAAKQIVAGGDAAHEVVDIRILVKHSGLLSSP